jgi:uncharacterized membrane protein
MDIVTRPGTISVSLKTASSRVQSIDLLRGLIMIIMALDHVRDYFHADAFVYEPTDLSKTNVILFFTRWITHFCAPTFMLLSGTSAFLVGVKKGKKYLSRFLFTRGLWLIFLELTVFDFAWYFNFNFPVIDFIVIWALGISMLALAALIIFPSLQLQRSIWSWYLVIIFSMAFMFKETAPVHLSGQCCMTKIFWCMVVINTL